MALAVDMASQEETPEEPDGTSRHVHEALILTPAESDDLTVNFILNLNLKLPAPRSSSVSYLDNNDNSSSSTFNLNCEHPPQHALLPASVPHQPHPSRRRHDSPLFCFLMSDYHLPRNRAIAQSDCATPASIEHGSSMNGSRTPPPARSGRRSSRGTVLLSPIPLSWVVLYVQYHTKVG